MTDSCVSVVLTALNPMIPTFHRWLIIFHKYDTLGCVD